MQRKGEKERKERKERKRGREERGRPGAAQLLVGFAEADWSHLLGFAEHDKVLRRSTSFWHAVLVLGRTTRRNRLQQGRVAHSRPRRDRLVPVGFSETDWVLFLEKKNSA